MDFKAIQQLVAFLNRNKIKSVKQLGSGIGQADLSDVFYQKLQSGDFKSDLEAANFFLKKDQKNKSYRELKIRFTRHLVDLLFLVDFELKQFTSYQKIFYRSIQELDAAKILFSRNLHYPAVFLAKKVVKDSEKIGHYEYIRQASKLLWTHYGSIEFNQRQHDIFYTKFDVARKVVELETKAQKHYSDLMLFHFSKKSNLSALALMSEKAVKELSAHENCPSNQFQMIYRLTRMIKFSASYDFVGMLDTSNEDLNFFISKGQINKLNLFAFAYQNALAAFRLGKYRQGLSTIENNLKIYPEGHFNWFSISHYKYLIHMHQGDYQAALDTYKSVTKHRAFKNLVPLHKENWTISGAYLAVLAEYGKLAAPLKKFKLGKFLNEIPAHAKDKQTRNIPILIVQMLFWLKREQKMKFIDCAEAVEQYVHRNLKRDHVLRYNILIKMLLKIPKQSFHPVAVKRHTRALAQKMQAESFDQAMPFDIEFLPNEVVWDLAMEAIS